MACRRSGVRIPSGPPEFSGRGTSSPRKLSIGKMRFALAVFGILTVMLLGVNAPSGKSAAQVPGDPWLAAGWGEETEAGTPTDTATEPEDPGAPPNTPVQVVPRHDVLTPEEWRAAKEAAKVTPHYIPTMVSDTCEYDDTCGPVRP